MPPATVQWSYNTDDAAGASDRLSPAVGADGTIYVGSFDNNLYAFNGDSSGLADSPWPMFGRDLRHTSQAK